MITYSFKPNFFILDNLQGKAEIKDLEKEVGVYSATPEFVRKHCGPIANNILDKIPLQYFEEAKYLGLYPNCDVRIHRLYPGDLPAYPGWHCDGEYRETYFSQPDLDKIKVHKHITCTISSHALGVSNTQFLDQSFKTTIHSIDNEHTLWGQINDQLEFIGRKKIYDTRDGELVHFDSWTLHRVMPSKIRGWRLFFRIAMWHKPNLGDGGMLTKQEQVYKLYGTAGW